MELILSGDYLLSLIVGAFALLACIGYGLLIMQTRRHSLQMAQLEARLSVFVDASINVARAIEQGGAESLGAGDVQARMPTRRWLLNEAKQRLQNGAAMAEVTRSLGLCRDEIQLLSRQVA